VDERLAQARGWPSFKYGPLTRQQRYALIVYVEHDYWPFERRDRVRRRTFRSLVGRGLLNSDGTPTEAGREYYSVLR
jgi:hypothetical protein